MKFYFGFNMQPRSFQQYIPAALAMSVFAVYLSTICPTVYVGDSGEFTAAAFCLGIPHNSGYPLYSLLGKLFCFIPLGHIGFRLNLMSTFFAVLTVWLVYSFILKITSSQVSAFVGAFVLAFTPILWSQTVSAEIYTLHTFFVALLIRLLWWWDEKRTLSRLALFVFVTGISFGNHMQTVMLAPAVLFIILSGDYKTLVSFKNFFFLSVLFVSALLLYLYLPIRTEAGAAIHWGDPNTLKRFLAHVTASAHRGGYVLTKGPLEYFYRTGEALYSIGAQFGVVLIFALLGWLKSASLRWRTFFVAVILFDLIYTVFLNIISLEITPFGLPTCIVMAILTGIGIAHILKATRRNDLIGKMAHKTMRGAFCILPAILLTFNLGLCNQSHNYTAYEHALNIFRTVNSRSTLFLDGDNNLFPVIYGRIVERMREDVILYDRYDLFFKMPFPDNLNDVFCGRWKDLKPIVEKNIVEKAQHGVFLAAYNPFTFSMPYRYSLLPYGILYRVFEDKEFYDQKEVEDIWNHYSKESFYDNFERDFMTREVSAYFHFSLGKYLFMLGRPAQGLSHIKSASRVGYNDTMIHSDIGVFLTDQGLFEEARLELEKALIHHEDLTGVYNNWGYYYYKLHDYNNAAIYYAKAIELDPQNCSYYNNLGLTLWDAGRKDEAALAFQKSLAIDSNQPKVESFLKR